MLIEVKIKFKYNYIMNSLSADGCGCSLKNHRSHWMNIKLLSIKCSGFIYLEISILLVGTVIFIMTFLGQNWKPLINPVPSI